MRSKSKKIVLVLTLLWAGLLTLACVPKIDNGDFSAEVSETVELFAAGDVMLARHVEKLIEAHGPGYPFLHTRDLIRGADISFANLESPIAQGGFKLPGKGIWFRASRAAAQILSSAGFDVLSLANNHILDYEAPALKETIEFLRAQDIKPVGAGRNLTEARSPVVYEVRGIRTGFLAYSDFADIYWHPEYRRSLRATDTLPGVAPLSREIILEDVAALKDAVDIIVISLHWGNEYVDHPDSSQRALARELIDAGADLVIGHHPHVFQGIEVYKQGVIAYSLGNFVFDQYWSTKTQQGLALRCRLAKEGISSVDVLPVTIRRAQPSVAGGDEGRAIVSQLVSLSRALDTKVEVINGLGQITLDRL